MAFTFAVLREFLVDWTPPESTLPDDLPQTLMLEVAGDSSYSGPEAIDLSAYFDEIYGPTGIGTPTVPQGALWTELLAVDFSTPAVQLRVVAAGAEVAPLTNLAAARWVITFIGRKHYE